MTTTDTARAMLRAADPAATQPTPDPDSAAAQALLERIVTTPATPRSRRAVRRRVALAAVGASAAVAATIAGVVATPWSHGHPTNAAYAVTRHTDGSVDVAVHWDQLGDPAALNADLAKAGARTVVMPHSTPGACTTSFVVVPGHAVPRIDPGLRDPAAFQAYLRAHDPWIEPVSASTDRAVFTIHPDKIPDGDTQLITYHIEPTTGDPAGNEDLNDISSLLVPDVPTCVPFNYSIDAVTGQVEPQ